MSESFTISPTQPEDSADRAFWRSLDPERICIIKPSAFGDVVQSLPLISVLRSRFPAAKLHWVIRDNLRGLVEGHPDLERVHIYHRRGGTRDNLRMLRELRQARFDLVFDLQGLFRTAVMTRMTGAPIRIGLETARELSHLVCHRLVKDTGRDVPAWRRYWRIAEALGCGDHPRITKVPESDADRTFVRQRLAHTMGPLLAIHPGAVWETKRWPPRRFAAVAGRFLERHSGTAILVGSPDENELASRVEEELRLRLPSASVHNLTGQTSLTQLAALLKSCDLLLSGDSGPMHLAAGLNVPVVSVFTCTDPNRSGPPPGPHRLIQTELPCGGSYHRKCPHAGTDHLACHFEITPERVANLLDWVWHERRTHRRSA